jgi:8-oxo-dGTP diphosphatase
MTDNPELVQYTADVVLLTSTSLALLIERDWPPFEGRWALPGGWVDEGETSLQAAVRELAEETGIHLKPADLRQAGVYDAPGRDPRGRYVTAVYTATVPDPLVPAAGDDARAARWWPISGLPELAFDHADILWDLTRPAS